MISMSKCFAGGAEMMHGVKNGLKERWGLSSELGLSDGN